MKKRKISYDHCVKNLVQHLMRSFTSLAIYSSFKKKRVYAKIVVINKTVINVSQESAFSIHFTKYHFKSKFIIFRKYLLVKVIKMNVFLYTLY
jgi:hypothetical protein